jgi:hypothetical protein
VTVTVRAIIALLVLIAAFVLVLTGRLDLLVGGMFVALAIAILAPPTRLG